jgi:hypothetical protein
MASSAQLVKMHTPAVENSDLPDPFSAMQRHAMAADIKAALKQCSSAEEMTAPSIQVMGTWAARPARRYAGGYVTRLQDLCIERFRAQDKIIEELKREPETMRHEAHVCQLRWRPPARSGIREVNPEICDSRVSEESAVMGREGRPTKER